MQELILYEFECLFKYNYASNDTNTFTQINDIIDQYLETNELTHLQRHTYYSEFSDDKLV